MGWLAGKIRFRDSEGVHRTPSIGDTGTPEVVVNDFLILGFSGG